LAAGGLLLVAVLSIPVLDGPHSRQYANEAAAVSRLRALTALEKTFAAAHADKGFACEVPLLKAAEKEESGVGHDLPLFLVTGTYAGYKFVLGNCRTDAKGVVAHFEATAVPVERGRTGFRAFCTDESGLLWFDPDGSATDCLKSRRALQE
jgi:hypothetical protein